MALTIGGLSTVGVGLLSLFNGVQGLVFGGEFQAGPELGISMFAACGVMFILFGVVGVVGGILALRGEHISLAFVGAFLGMLAGGMYGFWLGLVAIAALVFSDADL